MAKFGKSSLSNLAECDAKLVAVHEFVIEHYDHSVDDGARTLAEQAKNVAKGVSKTMESKHLPDSNGKSQATDSRPFPPPDWSKVEKALAAVRAVDPTLGLLRFYHFQGFVKGVATHMGVSIRQGIDWDSDNDLADQSFFDLPHNELK